MVFPAASCVDWIFTFAAATFNLIRIRNLTGAMA
jgi:hypothetical protein